MPDTMLILLAVLVQAALLVGGVMLALRRAHSQQAPITLPAAAMPVMLPAVSTLRFAPQV